MDTANINFNFLKINISFTLKHMTKSKKPQVMLVAFKRIDQNVITLETIAQSTRKTDPRKTSLSKIVLIS